MDEKRFNEFLDAIKANERVFYNYEASKPFRDIIDELNKDVEQFRYYTFDGRYQDLFLKLAKDDKYKSLGYKRLLNDLESELKKLIVSNIIMLPLNFLDSKIIKKDLILNDNIRIFLPSEKDLIKYSTSELLTRQEQRKEKQFNESICKYIDGILNGHLDKEHILLSKDPYFFKHPILTIRIEDIDVGAESEAKFITEAAYALLRMLDYKSDEIDFGCGAWENSRFPLARTYTVYYNDKMNDTSYYGYSFGFNFSNFLDINSMNFIQSKDLFCRAIEIYIKSRFIDKRKLFHEELDILNKWSNAILLYNTAYELASIEKYDACSLILCALMESIFIKNKGRNKSEILVNEITQYVSSFYSEKEKEKFIQAIKTTYKYRNKIVHEGIGFEYQFVRARNIYEPQGTYRGMKPFHYAGSFYPDKDLLGIDTILKSLVDILIGDKMLEKISAIVQKAH